MGSPLLTLFRGMGLFFFLFGATAPLIGEAEEVDAAKPLGAFNRDPNDLVLTVGGRMVVNHPPGPRFFEGCAVAKSFGSSE